MHKHLNWVFFAVRDLCWNWLTIQTRGIYWLDMQVNFCLWSRHCFIVLGSAIMVDEWQMVMTAKRCWAFCQFSTPRISWTMITSSLHQEYTTHPLIASMQITSSSSRSFQPSQNLKHLGCMKMLISPKIRKKLMNFCHQLKQPRFIFFSSSTVFLSMFCSPLSHNISTYMFLQMCSTKWIAHPKIANSVITLNPRAWFSFGLDVTTE